MTTSAVSVVFQEDLFDGPQEIRFKPRLRVVFTKRLVDFLESALALPLFDFESPVANDDLEERVLPVVSQDVLNQYLEPILSVNKSQNMRMNGGNDAWKALENDAVIEWRTSDWALAHIQFLLLSLDCFKAGHTAQERAEVVVWIFAGDWQEIDGERVWSKTIAFSFNACCAIAGYDPSTLQDFIFNKLPDPVQQMLVEAGAA